MIKLIVFLDLDGTNFVNSATDNAWIGGDSQFWIDTYAELILFAAKKGAELLYAIVSKKEFFDNTCEAAAKAFKPFLAKESPKMYAKFNGVEYCLVNIKGCETYESLSSNHSHNAVTQDAETHFEIISSNPKIHKSISIMRIAERHKIPLAQTVLFDDNPEILKEVEKAGIQTVSFACFFRNRYEILKDDATNPEFVRKNLERLKLEIFDKIGKMIEAALEEKNKSESKTEHSVQEKSAPTKTTASKTKLVVPYSLWNPIQSLVINTANTISSIAFSKSSTEE